MIVHEECVFEIAAVITAWFPEDVVNLQKVYVS